MLPTSPNLTATAEINTNAFMTLSKLAFSNLERLATLNLNATRAALEGGTVAVGSLSQSKDVKNPSKLLAGAAETASNNATEYLLSLIHI